MVKNTQTIRRQQPTNCLSVLDHFVKLALKGIKTLEQRQWTFSQCLTVDFEMIIGRSNFYFELDLQKLDPRLLKQSSQ